MDTPPLARGVTTSSERGLGLGMRARCDDGTFPRPPVFPSSHLPILVALTGLSSTSYLPWFASRPVDHRHLVPGLGCSPAPWPWLRGRKMALGHRTECP